MGNEWDDIVTEAKKGQVSKLPIYGLILIAALGVLIGVLADGTRAGLSLIASAIAFFGMGFMSRMK